MVTVGEVLPRALLAAFVLLLSASGCALGPDYKRPALDMPPAYRAEEAAPEQAAPAAQSLADIAWWDLFQDPVLNDLIGEALVANHDVRIAAKRVEQARYFVGITRADMLPQVQYDAGAERGKHFFGGGNNQTGNTFLAAMQMAWEIDIWGRIRRATEASLANLYATEDVQRGVILSLITDVAQAYFELRELDLELEIAQRTRDSFQQTSDLFERQLRGGVGTRLATARAAAALSNTAAVIPDLERLIVAKENQISILLGRPPGEIARGTVLTEQAYPPEIPAGLPSSLLERRPDILVAEQTIAAANAQVGVAITSFFPRIGLTALYGGQSDDLDNLLKKSGNIWSIGGALTGPIFFGGRLYYGYKGSKAAWEEAKIAYEQTVLNALAEVSNTLVAREKFAEAQVELEKQVDALDDAVGLSNQRFTGGFASYYEVLEAQQELFPAENALARNELNQLVSVVQLYRALGGGWLAEEQKNPDRYPRRREALDAIVPCDARKVHP
jgi:multidrug efflux system outer membrane protein